KHNAADSSPFSSMALNRPSSSPDTLRLEWNDSGSAESLENNCNLSSRYGQLLVIAGVINDTCRLYLNGIQLTSGADVAGSVQYGGDAPLVVNRSAPSTTSSVDSLTLDARIYNRELSADEIARLYPSGWNDLYYEYTRRYLGTAVLNRGDF